jgi:L-fucose isomerase-like protein
MKKEKQLKVGIISVGVPWFDLTVAQNNLDETRAWLSQSWQVVGPQQVVIDTPTLENAIQDFQTVNRPQVLIIQIGTFPDGEVPLSIAERLRVPIIIHSLPEPEIDKRIAINSLCGANLTTFTLTEMGFAHKAIHGFVSDPDVQVQMTAYVRAGLVLESLKQERIGLIGFRAPGFYPCVFDELLIRRSFGIGIDHIPLSEVVLQLQKGERRPTPVSTFPTIEGGELTDASVESIEKYYAALGTVLENSNLNLFAIKDWPEIMGLDDPGGIWPGLGWLLDQGFLLAPEGDVNAALTMSILHGLTGSIPFFADISAWDDESNAFALWHYGGAPSLAGDPSEIRYGEEGREVQFTLKPGLGTMVRFGYHHQQFRILAIRVEMLEKKVQLRRAGGWARTVNQPARDVVQTMLDDGWEHHVVLTYGDILPELRAISRFTGIPLTEL